ncbi:serine/threonine-protein kinase RsbW [Crossiella equi]|uniref:Serine/threonine-protein kinase RsbW n=1 Tax=Crossiella equi TaxID=130796 RepID=A0ABS5ALD2_9PSEU|nr:ATP-binding protein [Crossiella equi]MBP2477356.1 serine/threonine-protein kinase RsbW [Crossiella equi]
MSQPETASEPVVHPVEVRISATPLQISSVRAVAADLAMREDFDLDAIADLKLAVDEVCSTLVRSAAPGVVLTCQFRSGGGRIEVTASVLSASDATPRKDSFGWQVLTTLADEVDAAVAPAQDGFHLVRIDLAKRSTPVVGG